ncbi:MAG: tripartite tricarboxylate transporter TctB family protein [Alphaproteobacteria bacterium]|nr:tripartite tricarboxylate transporter TctB family protein [Alphaproteobacteria bacterium]
MELVSELMKVQIDFAQSHLFFPYLIQWLFVLLLAMIGYSYGIPLVRDIAVGRRSLEFAEGRVDVMRLVGALILTVSYIFGMEQFGAFFPNRGYGFLIASAIYILFLGLLFSHDFGSRRLSIILVNALVAPTVAWFVLARLFRITLP